jgi:hypothetical protein
VVGKSSLIFVWVVAGAFAQDKSLPKFEDYKVAEVFKGKPAQPVLTTPHQRLYRTRIRDAAANGPNFAGYYAIAEWGCGSNCASTAMVDLNTGHTWDLPFTAIGFPFMEFVKDPQVKDGLNYRTNSRLVILQGCPGKDECATYYMEWTGKEFKLIRKFPPISH